MALALALFAAIDIPLVYFSVRFFRSIHPSNTVVSTLGPGMRGPYTAAHKTSPQECGDGSLRGCATRNSQCGTSAPPASANAKPAGRG